MRRPSHVLALLPALVALLGLQPGCKEERKISAFPDSYSGVGMELEMRGDSPYVLRPIEGGPAAAAGVLAGEKVAAIDGEATAGMTLSQVVERVRGPKGTAVRLTLEKGGKKRTISVMRGKLQRTGAADRSGKAYSSQ